MTDDNAERDAMTVAYAAGVLVLYIGAIYGIVYVFRAVRAWVVAL